LRLDRVKDFFLKMTDKAEPIGWIVPDPARREETARELIESVDSPIYVYRDRDRTLFCDRGLVSIGKKERPAKSLPLLAWVHSLPPQRLGDPGFLEDHGLTYPYIAGAMAGGIASAEMVIQMGRAGMIGFFGSGGLSLEQIEAAIVEIQSALEDKRPYGLNLLHNHRDPALEEATVGLYLRRGVRRISASAYTRLNPSLIRYRLKGLTERPDGTIDIPNKILAKISRSEVAERFLSPPRGRIVEALLKEEKITAEEARLARYIPVADEITAEADSGGHTDRRPLVSLLPVICRLRDELVEKHGYQKPARVGAGGGISTPEAAAAAFVMGAAYVLTGSINQSCVEAGTCDHVKEILARAEMAHMAMAPAADMFELGAEVQVLKRGSRFSVNARRLYRLYENYHSIEEIPKEDRSLIEKEIFKQTIEETWSRTEDFFLRNGGADLLEKADKDSRFKMALIFRWYLGQSSRWAKEGEQGREKDYQVWCGPSMGAFNTWARGSFLESRENRTVVEVAKNILNGAAALIRARMLLWQGIPLGPECMDYRPRPFGIRADT